MKTVFCHKMQLFQRNLVKAAPPTPCRFSTRQLLAVKCPPPTLCFICVWCGWPAGLSPSLHSWPSPIVSHLVYWLEQPWRTGHHLKLQTTGCNKLENSSNLRKVLHSPELPNSLSSYPGQKIKKSIRPYRT